MCVPVCVRVCVCLCVMILEAPPTKADEEPTAMTLPSQAKINVHAIQTLKMLQFRCVAHRWQHLL